MVAMNMFLTFLVSITKTGVSVGPYNHSEVVYCAHRFYSTTVKTKQDAILLSYMSISKAKRPRVKDDHRKRLRTTSVKYFIVNETKEKKPVCEETFVSIFGVRKDRLSNISQYWLEKGTPMPEFRGGKRVSEKREQQKQLIKNHITSFTCRASHYARRGAPGRKYLPRDLSISKMHKLFLEQNHAQVTFSLYYNIFCYDFNLGFGTPVKDVCATCTKFKLKLKDPDLTDQEKQREATMFMFHRRRGRRFLDILSEVAEDITICFDVMENFVLPKTPVGQAYYSRQLYLYVFEVVRHHGSKQRQSMDFTDLFVWREVQNRKDSNRISSALRHYFTTVINSDLGECKLLHLFSDSCYGQNKNINLLSMLFALRKQQQPQMNIEYYFPIRGRSFSPADRVFGRIEQKLRKIDTICLPDEYISELRKHGRVHVYGEDWAALDFKSEVKKFVKQTRSFKLSEAKSVLISGDQLGFRTNYAGEYCFHSLLKKGKKWTSFNPPDLPMVNCVNTNKKTDVLSLCEEMGAHRKVKDFYEGLLQDDGMQLASVDSDSE